VNKIIAAVRSEKELSDAINSNVDMIFLLATNIAVLRGEINLVHNAGKKLFVHIDLADGIGKDEYGIKYVKALGADGIISTRNNLVKLAKKIGMLTVQRFFIVDSHSVETTLDSANSSKPDMIEIMPGTLTKVISRLKKELPMPIVAGGLIQSIDEVNSAISSGAHMVSTGCRAMWNI